MKASQNRITLVKMTNDEDERFKFHSEYVRWISPFLPGTQQIKPELLKAIADDVRYPTYNRERRRASGQKPTRTRKVKQLPPHPLRMVIVARRIERKGELDARKKALKDAARELNVSIAQLHRMFRGFDTQAMIIALDRYKKEFANA